MSSINAHRTSDVRVSCMLLYRIKHLLLLVAVYTPLRESTQRGYGTCYRSYVINGEETGFSEVGSGGKQLTHHPRGWLLRLGMLLFMHTTRYTSGLSIYVVCNNNSVIVLRGLHVSGIRNVRSFFFSAL